MGAARRVARNVRPIRAESGPRHPGKVSKNAGGTSMNVPLGTPELLGGEVP